MSDFPLNLALHAQNIGATGLDTLAVRRYAVSIGNGVLTSITVTHSLGTLDVQVQVYDNSTGLPVVPLTTTRATTNTIVFTFTIAPTTNAYRVVVFG